LLQSSAFTDTFNRGSRSGLPVFVDLALVSLARQVKQEAKPKKKAARDE
jgi:hypothetical protein